jgi:glycosyltransferase involved in cell wall biosynthesis
MRVAYLVNQYPHVSHTFIRREIAMLEEFGVAVERFSIRPPPPDLVDEADRAERGRTRVLLADRVGVVTSALLLALTRPLRWLTAIAAAIRLGRRSPRGVLRHLAYFCEACYLTRQLWARGATHLHAHFGTNPAAVAMFARLLGGPPYSFTAHGPEEFDQPQSLSLGEKVRHAAFAIAISSFGRSQLFRWCRSSDWNKIHVVRCGLDADFLTTPPTPVPNNIRLVCVGRLCEQKGQLLLIDAAVQLAKHAPGFELVLVGDGPRRAVLEQRIASHGLQDIVRITGWLSNAGVRREVQAARALVLPSFAEGLPVVLMEALALGRPVVTTFVAGIPELVRDGVNGWLIPAGDVDALAAAMFAVLSTPADKLTSMGSAGAAAVQKLHDVRREVAHLAELFRKSC